MDTLKNSAAHSQWAKIGFGQHHGIDIPLFSLHSQHSCGIGEYFDLIPLIPWCKNLGLDVIQLLPLNDSGNDSSPYSAISAFALHPIYLSLSQLPYLQDHPVIAQRVKAMQNQRPLPYRINYAQILNEKDAILHAYFLKVSAVIINTMEFQDFVTKNQDWLFDYAQFKALKLARAWQPWEEWPPGYNVDDEEVIYQIFLQYLCFKQMQKVKNVATQHELFIKGDIPILLSRESADVWRHPSLFQLPLEAGSEPDMFSKDGQNWNFPIYNWSEMEKEGYRWWKRRVQVAEQFYHLYRLDHVVGFFRIWAIPKGRLGKDGHYVPEDRSQWIPQGTKIMKIMLENTAMLPIAEDLGNVPPEVRVALKDLGICGTKVIRWERFWEGDKTFIPFDQYITTSMTTVSTHDSETLQQWWKNQPQEAKFFAQLMGWEYIPQLSLDKHLQILRASHHTPSLFHINLLQEYLAQVPGMTSADPDEERINVPHLVSDRNWSYRFVPSVEEIIASKPLEAVFVSCLS